MPFASFGIANATPARRATASTTHASGCPRRPKKYAAAITTARPISQRILQQLVPVVARLGFSEVLLLEIGRHGAVIEHYDESLTSGPWTMAFVFSGTALVLDGRTLDWKSRSFRNGSGKLVFRSEIEFLQRVGEAFNQSYGC